MSNDPNATDPNWKTKAVDANRKADPHADRLLGRIQGSEYSAVIIVLIVLALIGLGVWIAK
jgi:uncharacterized membrane protein YjgN (DUF898 family)